MTTKLNLECTDDDFHDLHLAVERTRKSSTTVTVPKEALRRLLSDHSAVLARFKKGDY